MKIFVLGINLILLTSVLALAQPDPGPPPPDPGVVPITGLEYLLLGGAAYGVYRFSKKKNSKNKEA